MDEARLSAQSIVTYTNLVKLVVASALDEDGEQLFPRKWSNEFIDLPVIENQYQPAFTVENVPSILEKAKGPYQVLYALLAGTGLRIGEAFGLEIKHLSSDCRTITVEQSCFGCSVQKPKTKNAYRQVDLCTPLAGLLKSLVGNRQSGFVFANHAGHPLSQTNVLRRSLHPILKELGVNRTGFHAFRRFRNTFLRNYTACPDGLRRFWLGWGDEGMSGHYDKICEDSAFRREVAEKVAVGFAVPASMSPMSPRKSVTKAEQITA
jgi:integrase